VFAARDAQLGIEVAVKLLHPHLTGRGAAREAFFAEARRAVSLNHPAIVGVLDFGFDETAAGSYAWIALERATGSNLSDHVGRHGALSPAEAVTVIEGILEALGVVHAAGLVHRDVSPANIMVAVNASGSIERTGVRLLDFGLADVPGASTRGEDHLLSRNAVGRAGVIGNVNYMSPEQVRGAAVDTRGDVYQVGAVLYFALTGRPPFARASTGQIMRAHLDTPPPVPSALVPAIPRALDRVVVRAMLKDPDDRFDSVVVMGEALQGLSLEVDARPSAPLRIPVHVGDVTRVLGRTMVLANPPAGVSAAGAGVVRQATTARSNVRVWLVATVGVAIAAMILAAAATASPTALVNVPSPTPTTETGASPQPQTPAQPVPSLHKVPDLAGLTLAEAHAAITQAGLAPGEVSAVESPFPEETVLRSSPAAGELMRVGASVALTIASGYNAVPDVEGLSREEAAALVEAAGFTPLFAYRATFEEARYGSTLGTLPLHGGLIAVGRAVTIFEAVPAIPEPTPTPSGTTNTDEQ